jgi:hypothetical protein
MKLQNGSCTTPSICGVDIGAAVPNDTVKFSTNIIRIGLEYKFR